MSRKCWRKSTLNITTGMYMGTSRCWDSLEVYKVDTSSIIAFSAIGTAVQLTSIMFKENGKPENNHCQAHTMLFMKPLFQLTRSCNFALCQQCEAKCQNFGPHIRNTAACMFCVPSGVSNKSEKWHIYCITNMTDTTISSMKI